MKILHVSAYKEGSGGGEGRINWELARECTKAGIESKILAPNDANGYGFKFSKKGILEVIEYPSDVVLDFMCFFKFTLTNIKRLYEILDEFNPDIIHFHTPVPLILLLELWAIKNSKKIVHTIHENPSKLLSYGLFKEGSFMDKFTKKIGLDYYLNTIFEGVDYIISVNNLHNKAIVDFGYKGKLSTIFNGRNLKDFNILKNKPINKKLIKLFFTGLICHRKNQLYLARVLEYLPRGFELNLLGNNYDNEYLNEISLYKNVRILGDIPFEKLPKIIEDYDIFVSASLEEAFSLSVIEALAAGKPVVALENDTIKLLINSKNGVKLKTTASPEQFADAILKVSQLSVDSYLNTQKASRLSVSMYDWSCVIQEYKEIYNNLLESNVVDSNLNSNRLRLISELLSRFAPQVNVKDLYNNAKKKNSVIKIQSIVVISSLIVLLTTIIFKFVKKK